MNGKSDSNNLVYTLDGKIYVNLTNSCTNHCIFCIRNLHDEIEGKNLWLKDENYAKEDVTKQFEEIKAANPNTKEVVYCGYGEPLIKLEMFKETSRYIKEHYPEIKIRINTNGQGNLIHKRNIITEIKPTTDAISISLNSDTKEGYNAISMPNDKENSYDAVKAFIKGCAEAGIETGASIVTGYKDTTINTEECRKVAESLGAKMRIREWLPVGY